MLLEQSPQKFGSGGGVEVWKLVQPWCCTYISYGGVAQVDRPTRIIFLTRPAATKCHTAAFSSASTVVDPSRRVDTKPHPTAAWARPKPRCCPRSPRHVLSGKLPLFVCRYRLQQPPDSTCRRDREQPPRLVGHRSGGVGIGLVDAISSAVRRWRPPSASRYLY